ncbi:NUDIX hydrolase [Teredinibacter purpureus]|uniref:NUDIX hydrolase n=1 Tax=Teredinibacter purpureus TaxID=2731756 RepID=UPI0005F862DA|nr:NUDIX hydrolase [Teredinibacter purpureus]
MKWYPHVTVATIVERDNLFLMVEENKNGALLLNQPAGHLEQNETLFTAAIRETKEETQWEIKLEAFLGNSLFTSPVNNITYMRTSFIASALRQDQSQPLDPDIESALWLSIEQIRANKHRLRSPMVLSDIERYLTGERYPLTMLEHF